MLTTNFQRNLDDDPFNLIESRREVTAEECNESPVPNKKLVPGLGKEEISCDEQKCGKQDNPCNLMDSRKEVTGTAEECNESPVPNKIVVSGLGSEAICCDEQECGKKGDPTPSPEQVEVSLINDRLSNIQTKSAVSRRFSDSVKQERLLVISDLHILFSSFNNPLSLPLILNSLWSFFADSEDCCQTHPDC